MISNGRAIEVASYAALHGFEAAQKHFGFNRVDTVRRYVDIQKGKIDVVSSELPKVLFFDIETAPYKADVWSMWKQNIQPNQINHMGYVLCYSAKWMGSAEILNACVTPDEVKDEDDGRVMRSLWALMDDADILVAHNGKKFDRRVANTRFILSGLQPTSPYRFIDTLEALKDNFLFPHNRLDAVNKVLGLSRKVEHEGHELWTKCTKGDADALRRMQEYCDGDILALEDTYFALSPWMRTGINFGLYYADEETRCHRCGSKDVSLTDKYFYTSVSKFPMYKCSCGAYSRARTSALSLKKRQSLITAIGKGM